VALKIRTYRIGTPRKAGEGLRIGTVRYLPRGVRKEDYASKGYFDVWFPLLSPSKELVASAHSDQKKSDKWFPRFEQRFRREMTSDTNARQAVKLIAELARTTSISIGCYCPNESLCHRSVLLQMIREAGANSNWPQK